MRQIPDELAARIDSGTANLATAFILTRADGTRLGFTDHDRDLVVQGVLCEAASGWTGGAADSELGFSPGTASAQGALESAALEEADIARGLYDGATVDAWRVDWSDPSLSVLLWSGRISRLVREGPRFTAEIAGPLAALDQVAGRTFGKLCDAALGDARCKADVSGSAFNGAGTVVSVHDNRRLVVTGLDGFAAGWFAHGRLVFASGAATDLVAQVAAHQAGAAGVALVLRERPLAEVAAGDGFTVRAGCDKRYSTCRALFGNSLNFQGFPHIPGDDFLMAYPRSDGRNDGTSRRGGSA